MIDAGFAMDKTAVFNYKVSIMRRFFIKPSDIRDNTAEITGQDARHLTTVLRITCDDTVELFDGEGHDFKARVETATARRVTLTITETSVSRRESPAHITIAQGMLKDKKMDMLIRHLTELGIVEWIPFFGARSVPKPDEKRVQQRMKRWEKIAKEALKQCGRSLAPGIKQPVSFQQLLEASDNYDEKIAFFEKATVPLTHLQEKNREPGRKFIVLIGPEGGFSDREAAAAEDHGFGTFTLGPRILRAETASITACALVQHFFGDLG